MQVLEALGILTVLSAAVSYANQRFLRLPNAVGILLVSIAIALTLKLLQGSAPEMLRQARELITVIEFDKIVLSVLLAFLLFAGSVQIDLNDLRSERTAILTLAILSTTLSASMVGGGLYYIMALLGAPIPFNGCLIFGALIAPTDPVAVLGILKRVGLPKSLETKIAGESLFNDGVGIVLFLLFTQSAEDGGHVTLAGISETFLQEVGGGLLLGAGLGLLCMRLAESIDHYQTEVLLTVALVTGGYALAGRLHVSGPLAMVVAGIIVGNPTTSNQMSETTRDYLDKFWELVDESANSVLFLLIGLEVMVLHLRTEHLLVGVLVIGLVLGARYLSVALPLRFLALRQRMERGALPILTWGGLRGGISVALALTLPALPYKDFLVSITYVVVVFSITVQGLTIGRLAKKYV